MHTIHISQPENRNGLLPVRDGRDSNIFASRSGASAVSETDLTALTGFREASAAPEGTDTDDLLCFSNDDCGNAQRLIRRHGSDLFYSHAEKAWRHWTGAYWSKDETDQTRALGERVINEFGSQARAGLNRRDARVAASMVDPQTTLRYAEKCLNRGPLTNMLAEAQRKLAVTPEQMDRDPHLLNFADKTVDLRTGEARNPDRKDYITRRISFPYLGGKEECPRFLQFLNWAMDGDRDPQRARVMSEYLQMCLGYAFTGFSVEKAIFICFGAEGNNGKTLFLNLMRRIAENYGTTIRVSSLMAKRDSNSVSSDLADLRGARFVMTSESEAGMKLSQATLKFLTQGQGETRARRLRENWITFRETHSIWLDTNILPAMPNDVEDPALNRLVPIEFRAQIARDKIDRNLGDTLYAEERSGITAWIVRGAVKWFESGQKLPHPPEIDLARDHWRRTDPFARFVEDRCVVEPGGNTSARAAHQEFLRWWKAEAFHGEPLSETSFGIRMKKRFQEGKHTERGWIYLGVRLREL